MSCELDLLGTEIRKRCWISILFRGLHGGLGQGATGKPYGKHIWHPAVIRNSDFLLMEVYMAFQFGQQLLVDDIFPGVLPGCHFGLLAY